MRRGTRKGSTELNSLRNIRTSKKSIPRIQSSPYLDLYVLGKEKDRLEKEIFILDKRRKSIEKRVTEINAEMKRSEEAQAAQRLENRGGINNSSEKEWKKMPIKY